jgi:DNA-directed RNA polymerase III subunit RPC4
MIVDNGEDTKPVIKKDPAPAPESSDSDVVMIDENRSGQRAGLLHDESIAVHIKPEPVDEDSLPAIAIKEPLLPEAKHSKAKGKGKEPVPIAGAGADKKKRKPASKKRDGEPAENATAEDKAEYERHLEDVRVLAQELGGMQTQPQEDVAMEGAGEVHDQRSGRLYLFQFPGVLPKLYNPLTKKLEKPKPKGKEAEKDKETEITSSTSNPQKKPPIKVEDGGEVTVKHEEEAVKKPEEVVDEVGAVGRMVVRKSGRVEITWGDNDMVVQRGTSHGFLGAGYIIDSLDRVPVAPTEGVDRIGFSTSMGPMMGKFVVVPDFEKTW